MTSMTPAEARWIETTEDADAFLASHHNVRLEFRRKRGGWVAAITEIDGTPCQGEVCPMPHTPMTRKNLERTLAHRYLAVVTDDGASVNLRWARLLPNWADDELGALPELARAIEQVEREAATVAEAIARVSNAEDGAEYRVAFEKADGSWDIVETFDAESDADANAYAEQSYSGREWYVLDANGRNINGGRDQ